MRAETYSSLSLYGTCPRLYEDRYVHKNYSAGTWSEEKAAAGQSHHNKLEKFFLGRGPFPSSDKVLRFWQPYMTKLKDRGLVPEQELAVDQQWRRVPYNDPSAWFRGKIDGSLGGEVYDWKSGRVYAEHREQGRKYAALKSPDHDGDFLTRFVYLDIPVHVVEWRITPAEVAAIKQEVDGAIEVIQLDQVFSPKPNDKCKYCHLSWRKGGRCEAAP